MRDPVPGSHEPGFVEPALVQEKIPEAVKRALPLTLGIRVYSLGECSIIMGRENPGGGRYLWHLTISHPERHPSWDEIKTARYRLLPLELCFAMFLPPPANYVNLPAQDHVFQLWESDDPNEPWKE